VKPRGRFVTLVEDDRTDSLGTRIRLRREELGKSQSALARDAKVSQSTIARLETGERTPSFKVLLRLAEALRVDPGYLTR
jgi:transcriptional regulator with XRE-family HTH domain